MDNFLLGFGGQQNSHPVAQQVSSPEKTSANLLCFHWKVGVFRD